MLNMNQSPFLPGCEQFRSNGKQLCAAAEQPAPFVIGIGNILVKVNAIGAVQVFIQYLPYFVVVDF